MKPAELAKARGELVAFAAQMLARLPRCDRRRWGETYLRGLMLDGRRHRAARLDRRRHRLPQGGTLLGRRRPSVLGHPRQGRGLPDRRLGLGRLRGGQLPAYLAVLPRIEARRPLHAFRCATQRNGFKRATVHIPVQVDH